MQITRVGCASLRLRPGLKKELRKNAAMIWMLAEGVCKMNKGLAVCAEDGKPFIRCVMKICVGREQRCIPYNQ